MATRLALKTNLDSCPYAYGGGRGLFDCIVARDDYVTKYPLDTLYPMAGRGLSQLGRKGEFLVADPLRGQLFHCKDFMLRLIAGRYNAIGHRDGPGPQALICPGGLQDHYSVARNSKGEWFLPQRNGKVRKIITVDDGPCQVSTFAENVQGSGLACDSNDNLWVSDFYGAALTKLSPDGKTRQRSPLITSNVLDIVIRGTKIVGITRFNSWDIVIEFDMLTGKSVRLAGRLESEIVAYCQANGINLNQYGSQNHDGAALGEAAFHSTGMPFVNDDVSEIFFIGGDECQFRRWRRATGRVDTLHVDGTWRETNIRVGAPHPNTEPKLPFFSRGGFGRQPDGLPACSTPIFFVPEGRTRWVSDIIKIEVPDQPPPGGTMLKAKFISQNIPATMETGKEYVLEVEMENTGDEPWTVAKLDRLGTQNPVDNSTWQAPGYKTNRMPLAVDAPVAPGQRAKFRKTVIAPAVGERNCQWKMVREGVTWFGDPTPNVVVKIVAAAPPPLDLPPTIDAVADPIVRMPDAIKLSATVTDPEGKPVTVQWSQISGPLGPPASIADPTALETTAQPWLPGDYIFNVAASDGINAITSQDLPVLVLPKIVEPPPPPVITAMKITFPASFFKPPETLKVAVTFSDGSTQEPIATVEIEPA